MAKAAGVIAGFFLPVMLGAWLGGRGLQFAAVAFAGAQGINLAIGLGGAVLPVLQLAFTRYELDGHGVRVRMELLARSDRRVPWEKVTLVRHRQTIVDRLFGLERIDVVAYGVQGTTLHLVGLRSAAALREALVDKMRRHASVGGRLGDD